MPAHRELKPRIARTEREIALMQEYRTRLTADVVTGQPDVRAAARLPDLSAAGPGAGDEMALAAGDTSEEPCKDAGDILS